jgi:hypothetical protein
VRSTSGLDFFYFFIDLPRRALYGARLRELINRGGQGNRLRYSRINCDLSTEAVAFVRLRK